MDIGKSQNTLLAAPELGGKLNYNSDYSGQNYSQHAETVSEALTRLQASLGQDRSPSVFVQSLPLRDYMPSFEAGHIMPLVSGGTAPRAWIGNQTTVQTHFDISENIACVVAGRRRFTLFAPDQLPNLYLGPLESAPGGTPVSTTNLDEPDFNAHPKFRQALENAAQIELSPGDALYIPMGWFHHVRALAPINMLVNYWWRAPGAQVEQPWAALLHSVMAFRNIPEADRAVWQGLFSHFAFLSHGEPMMHLPHDRRGFFGGVPDAHRGSQIYEILAALGPEIGLDPPPRK